MIRLASAVLLALFGASVARAQSEATFRIHDRMDPNEIEETTAVYIETKLIRTIHLDRTHESEVVTVTVPASAAPSYALCGRITIRTPEGLAETHEVDGSGTLTDVDGRDFDAVAAEDFTVFFLADITAGRAPVPVRINRARSCAEALS